MYIRINIRTYNNNINIDNVTINLIMVWIASGSLDVYHIYCYICTPARVPLFFIRAVHPAVAASGIRFLLRSDQCWFLSRPAAHASAAATHGRVRIRFQTRSMSAGHRYLLCCCCCHRRLWTCWNNDHVFH